MSLAGELSSGMWTVRAFETLRGELDAGGCVAIGAVIQGRARLEKVAWHLPACRW